MPDEVLKAIRTYLPEGSNRPGDVDDVDFSSVVKQAGLSSADVKAALGPKLARRLAAKSVVYLKSIDAIRVRT